MLTAIRIFILFSTHRTLSRLLLVVSLMKNHAYIHIVEADDKVTISLHVLWRQWKHTQLLKSFFFVSVWTQHKVETKYLTQQLMLPR